MSYSPWGLRHALRALRTDSQVASRRVNQLEEKIDGIMSLLSGGQRGVNNQISDQHLFSIPNTRTEPDAHSSLISNPETVRHTRVHFQQTPVTVAATSSSIAGSAAMDEATPQPDRRPTPLDEIDIVPGFRMTFNEVDAALDLYRSAYNPYFPFVPLPASMTGLEVYSATPFLLRTILQVVVPQTSAVQKTVQMWFRQSIAQYVVVEQERRLELLQAILVFVAW